MSQIRRDRALFADSRLYRQAREVADRLLTDLASPSPFIAGHDTVLMAGISRRISSNAELAAVFIGDVNLRAPAYDSPRTESTQAGRRHVV